MSFNITTRFYKVHVSPQCSPPKSRKRERERGTNYCVICAKTWKSTSQTSNAMSKAFGQQFFLSLFSLLCSFIVLLYRGSMELTTEVFTGKKEERAMVFVLFLILSRWNKHLTNPSTLRHFSLLRLGCYCIWTSPFHCKWHHWNFVRSLQVISFGHSCSLTVMSLGHSCSLQVTLLKLCPFIAGDIIWTFLFIAGDVIGTFLFVAGNVIGTFQFIAGTFTGIVTARWRWH